MKKTPILSAMFLVAGLCIGGGMLALPISTGLSGFIPSTAVLLACWLAMTATGLLLIEASLWFKEEVHIISMASHLLGKWGKAVSWVVYLFICYASTVAYTAGGAVQISDVCYYLTGITLTKSIACIIFLILFVTVIDMGATIIGRVNAILFTGMIVAFLGMMGWGLPRVDTSLLSYQHWPCSFMSIPFLLTAFSFQTMAPSMTPFLNRDKRALRIAIIGGTTIACVVYLIWQVLILGLIPPEGENSIRQALEKGELATTYLRALDHGQWIGAFADFFAFFALVTSFLGISLGLFDFLADGLSISKKGKGKLLLVAIIAIPTLFFAIFFERAFMIAIDLSGGLGDSILSGVIPVLMVWVGRYSLKYKGERFVPGGKIVLVIIAVLFALSFLLELGAQVGWLPSLYDLKEIHWL